eukprot:CAMPEP_0115538248 /NCGR_PEP_ID=MMETSP0271-20121206/88779_1 /TAXON_ID=71861 /ORGANISM="Scrippsiella trochoidea, Strain CCMP3099" /LENGTH=258 /DNA_ID=CAMNT_0002971135 /DNA_START=57 /DNA_END=830 /DNA_ORIENTATION=-
MPETTKQPDMICCPPLQAQRSPALIPPVPPTRPSEDTSNLVRPPEGSKFSGPFGASISTALEMAFTAAQGHLQREHEMLMRLREKELRSQMNTTADLPSFADKPKAGESSVWFPKFTEVGTQTRVDYNHTSWLDDIFHAPAHNDAHVASKVPKDDESETSWSLRKADDTKAKTPSQTARSSRLVGMLGGKMNEQNADDEDLTGVQRLRYQLSSKTGQAIIVDQAMGVIIILNAILIGVSCDTNPDSDAWLVVDFIFAA